MRLCRRGTGQVVRTASRRRLGELCGLLALIGWAESTTALAVTLDLGRGDCVVEKVLEAALELAQEEALADAARCES
jgi:hypothetical protein